MTAPECPGRMPLGRPSRRTGSRRSRRLGGAPAVRRPLRSQPWVSLRQAPRLARASRAPEGEALGRTRPIPVGSCRARRTSRRTSSPSGCICVPRRISKAPRCRRRRAGTAPAALTACMHTCSMTSLPSQPGLEIFRMCVNGSSPKGSAQLRSGIRRRATLVCAPDRLNDNGRPISDAQAFAPRRSATSPFSTSSSDRIANPPTLTHSGGSGAWNWTAPAQSMPIGVHSRSTGCWLAAPCERPMAWRRSSDGGKRPSSQSAASCSCSPSGKANDSGVGSYCPKYDGS